MLGADPTTEGKRLAGLIADHLRPHGHHLTHMDSQVGQALIDLKADAVLAGR